MKTKLFLA